LRSALRYTDFALRYRFRISSAIRLMFIGLSAKYDVPSCAMTTTGKSCTFSRMGLTFGTSTSRPNSITWAVSMKMISSTRTTSTSGTTLISASELTPRKRPRLPVPAELVVENAMSVIETSFHEIQELEDEIFHAGPEFLDRAPEYVVENRGGKGSPHPPNRCDKPSPESPPNPAQTRCAPG